MLFFNNYATIFFIIHFIRKTIIEAKGEFSPSASRVASSITTRREVSFRIASFLFTLNASLQIKHGNA